MSRACCPPVACRHDLDHGAARSGGTPDGIRRQPVRPGQAASAIHVQRARRLVEARCVAAIVVAAIVVTAVMATASLVGLQAGRAGRSPRSGREPAVVSPPAGLTRPQIARPPAVGLSAAGLTRAADRRASSTLSRRPGSARLQIDEPPAARRGWPVCTARRSRASAGCQPHGLPDRPAPQAHPHASVSVVRTTTEGSIDSRRLNAH